jgi:hypothetical protein
MFKRNLPERSSWRRYQRAQWLVTLTNVAFVMAAVAIVELAPWLFDSNVDLVIAARVVAVPNLVAGYWLRNFPCPRCHRPFFWVLPSRMFHAEPKRVEFNLRQETQLARTCRNCGLRIWQDA